MKDPLHSKAIKEGRMKTKLFSVLAVMLMVFSATSLLLMSDAGSDATTKSTSTYTVDEGIELKNDAASYDGGKLTYNGAGKAVMKNFNLVLSNPKAATGAVLNGLKISCTGTASLTLIGNNSITIYAPETEYSAIQCLYRINGPLEINGGGTLHLSIIHEGYSKSIIYRGIESIYEFSMVNCQITVDIPDFGYETTPVNNTVIVGLQTLSGQGVKITNSKFCVKVGNVKNMNVATKPHLLESGSDLMIADSSEIDLDCGINNTIGIYIGDMDCDVTIDDSDVRIQTNGMSIKHFNGGGTYISDCIEVLGGHKYGHSPTIKIEDYETITDYSSYSTLWIVNKMPTFNGIDWVLIALSSMMVVVVALFAVILFRRE